MHTRYLVFRCNGAGFRSLAASVALLLTLSCLHLGCATIEYNAKYGSDVHHDPLPLKTSVNVVVTSELREEWKDRNRQDELESVRQTFQSALKADLATNGPLTPTSVDPEARLVVKIKALKGWDLMLWVTMFFVAPIWLFGVPMKRLYTSLGVEMELKTATTGEMLYYGTQEAECTHFQGIYYGYYNLNYGCVVKKIAERMRDQISIDRADILAKVDRARPKAIPAARPMALGQRPIAVVFNIQDMSGKFDGTLVDQLTEYLSAQVGQRLKFKVAPREKLRERLSAVKTDSYKQCYDRSCQIELGKALAANKTVSTTLIQIGTNCIFNSTVIDLKTEAAELSASAKGGCGEDQLLESLGKVVQALAGK